MINRVIKDNEVYYAIADLCILFDCTKYKMNKAIKQAEIECIKIFGNTRFVKEKDVDKIVINDINMTMKTTVKDFQAEIKSSMDAAKLANFCFGIKKTDEDLLSSVFKNTIKKFDKEDDHIEDTNEISEDQKMKVFNSICDRSNYSERIHKVVTKDSEKGEKHNLYVIVSGDETIRDAYSDLTIEDYKKDLENGFVPGKDVEWDDEDKYLLTAGNPLNIDEVGILALLLNNKNNYEITFENEVDIKLDNDEIVSVNDRIYFDLIHNGIKIIKNDLEEALLNNIRR
ncbi:hypothetical protein [Paraclostridium bifermentans]|uniref:hypothetical protein n=1 Tax=Paraclostridium bifermentans TaxID=1490 RepID=UPI00290FF6F8|nr:hypothetical protein [Paraclostridium bifermentans]MDU3337939.1 hypothetical protein [Paraclostridium bifermentans]